MPQITRGEFSRRRNVRLAKIPHGKFTGGEISLDEISCHDRYHSTYLLYKSKILGMISILITGLKSAPSYYLGSIVFISVSELLFFLIKCCKYVRFDALIT